MSGPRASDLLKREPPDNDRADDQADPDSARAVSTTDAPPEPKPKRRGTFTYAPRGVDHVVD